MSEIRRKMSLIKGVEKIYNDVGISEYSEQCEAAFDIGEWQMITIVYDASQYTNWPTQTWFDMQIYKDAQIIYDSGVYTWLGQSAWADGMNKVRLADISGSSYQLFPGIIDGFMIFDRVLELGEIQGLIPEPATIALLGLGGLALLRKRR